MRFAVKTALVCDACGTRGPAGGDEHDAVNRADADGWLLETGPDTARCRACRQGGLYNVGGVVPAATATRTVRDQPLRARR